ncbi:MAG: twin transmembrane helix small protein [Halocynthiibacter sp.]
MFQDPLLLIVVAAIFIVLAILTVGIVGFALGGDFNRKHANRIMRYRIAGQAVAVALLLLFVYLRSGG